MQDRMIDQSKPKMSLLVEQATVGKRRHYRVIEVVGMPHITKGSFLSGAELSHIGSTGKVEVSIVAALEHGTLDD